MKRTISVPHHDLRQTMHAVDALSRAFLLLVIGVCVLVALRSLSRPEVYLQTAIGRTVLLWLPAATLLLLGAALRCSRTLRVNLAMLLAGVLAALYLGELAVIIVQPYLDSPVGMRGYDRRTKLQVIEELSKSGSAAYPAVHPRQIMGDSLRDSHGRRILPLAGIAGVPTVLCNEWGRWYVYRSDEYGFNNPPGLWRAPLSAAVIGDSFAQGFCLPDGKSFVELMRAQHPGILNVASSGNGPLAELAALREYLTDLRPRRVLWFYYEGNDIEDLTREMQDPVLASYLLDPSFEQGLKPRVREIDGVLREYLDQKISDERNKTALERIGLKDIRRQSLEWLKLYNLRKRVGLMNFRHEWVLNEYRHDIGQRDAEQAFRSIMRAARDQVAGWGGRLYVIYLPGWESFAHVDGLTEHPFRGAVLETLRTLEIPVLDLLPVFAGQPDPLELFPYAAHLHYNERGSGIVAEAALQLLER